MHIGKMESPGLARMPIKNISAEMLAPDAEQRKITLRLPRHVESTFKLKLCDWSKWLEVPQIVTVLT